MNADTSPPQFDNSERRRRGRRPGDAALRRVAVERALADLTAARVPFSMADLAERAGISRATLYRDAGLRDLIGGAGDSPATRPVDARDFGRLEEKSAALAEERRTLRRTIRALERQLDEAKVRIERLEEARAAVRRERASGGDAPESAASEKTRTEAFAAGFAAGARAYQQRASGARGGEAAADLIAIAARLPRPAMLSARKTLARAIHPDLYANDPATALLATELLKQINALAESHR